MAAEVGLNNKAFLLSYVDSVAHQATIKHSPLVRIPTSFTYIDNSWNWSTYNYFSIPHSPSADEQSRARAACVLGTIVTFIAAGIFGFAAKSWKMNAVSLKETKKIKQASYEAHLPFVGIKINTLATTQEKVDQINMSRSNHYVAAATMTLLGGAVLLVGGLTSTSALITAGTIVAVAGIAFGLGAVCYHCSDSQDIRRIYERDKIDELIPKIKAALEKYDDEMNLLPPINEKISSVAIPVIHKIGNFFGAGSEQDVPPPPYQEPSGYKPVPDTELDDDSSDSDVEIGHPAEGSSTTGEASAPPAEIKPLLSWGRAPTPQGEATGTDDEDIYDF